MGYSYGPWRLLDHNFYSYLRGAYFKLSYLLLQCIQTLIWIMFWFSVLVLCSFSWNGFGLGTSVALRARNIYQHLFHISRITSSFYITPIEFHQEVAVVTTNKRPSSPQAAFLGWKKNRAVIWHRNKKVKTSLSFSFLLPEIHDKSIYFSSL